MDHIEPDELAVLALDGRTPEGPVRDHLDECGECRAEYDAFARTADLGRGVPDDELEPPPPGVWSAIHRELGLGPALAADPFAADDPVAPAATAAPEAAPSAAAEPEPAPSPGAAHVPPRRVRPPRAGADGSARRRRRAPWFVAAVAAVGGILAGIGLGVAIAGIGGGTAPEPSVVLATAELDAFPGWQANGSATVEEDSAGERTIVVDLDAAVPDGEVREVWLIRADASGLVSLGLMDGDSATFVVPAGIDLAEYPLVDVSAEPVDGDPAHSGDSIVRGELRSA